MIYFDVTSVSGWRHVSGLTRVSSRLREELAGRAVPARWPEPENPASKDVYLTAELFSESERPGISRLLERHPCRMEAIFHDAIPLKFPAITWKRSVARQPEYMKLLAGFDRVWAVSEASRNELLGFWAWQGTAKKSPVVEVLNLGADFGRTPRVISRLSPAGGRPSFLCVGIIEPRKNQDLLLTACEALWSEGLDFELHFVGRVNPEFGRPVERRIRSLSRTRNVHFHCGASDRELRGLYAEATACAFPTIAEGCGLPLIEALWLGIPCVHSDLPVLMENSNAGGCLPVPVQNPQAWTAALRSILLDESLRTRLTREAADRPLPTWAEAADQLCSGIEG